MYGWMDGREQTTSQNTHTHTQEENKSSHINVVNKTKEKIHQTKTCATRVIMVVVLFFYKKKKRNLSSR